jgi:ribosomal-protein-alanine N-acetyltransferase
MLAKLVGKLSKQRRTRVTLDVRETNLDAQLFFRARGFRCAGVQRAAYEDSGEDAYTFVYRLPTAANG